MAPIRGKTSKIGILLDIHGVLLLKDRALADAKEFIDFLNSRKITHRLVTNMAYKSVDEHYADLQTHKINVRQEYIYTPCTIARDVLSQMGIVGSKVLRIGEFGFQHELAKSGFILVDSNPELIIIPKLKSEDDIEKVRSFMNNKIPVVSTNMDSKVPTSEKEFVVGALSTFEKLNIKNVKVIGKPNPLFFQTIIKKSDLQLKKWIVIGDSIDSDIQGAKNAGLESLLVKSAICQIESATKQFTNINQVIEYLSNELKRLN